MLWLTEFSAVPVPRGGDGSVSPYLGSEWLLPASTHVHFIYGTKIQTLSPLLSSSFPPSGKPRAALPSVGGGHHFSQAWKATGNCRGVCFACEPSLLTAVSRTPDAVVTCSARQCCPQNSASSWERGTWPPKVLPPPGSAGPPETTHSQQTGPYKITSGSLVGCFYLPSWYLSSHNSSSHFALES